jgi:hypothetical protein
VNTPAAARSIHARSIRRIRAIQIPTAPTSAR